MPEAREPLFLPWIEMESMCGCFRRRCRHRRRVERENLERRLEHEQLAALTNEDIDWLRENGWNR